MSPLPQVDFPTIAVSAALPGASPETMAATVATPLERALGRIAGVTEMTSSSSLGSTRITLQFDLNRDIDGAARDVQAAINAARSQLPSNLPGNPNYKKVNPADAPIMILALTSDTMTQGQMYDAASTILAQKLSQVKGMGEVDVGGSSLPAVRVELNPTALNKYGIGLEDVRIALAAANANRPKGFVETDERHWQIYATDQARTAKEYVSLIVAFRNGAPVRLSDVAEVVDSVQDLRNAGSANGKPSVLLILNRQPGANIIATVDRVRLLLPQLRAEIPAAIDLTVMNDRTLTIRSALREVERTLVISTCLVILVVFLFLRNGRATLIPAVAVPVSLIGTFRRHVSVRLQPRQLVLDGAHGRHRLRRGRCHRGAGEHLAPHRGRHGAVQGGAAGRARSGLHGAVDERVADRGVHSDPADGRHRRAPVPRIRGDAVGGDPGVAGGVADHHADDVRLPAEAARARSEAQPALSREPAGLRLAARSLPDQPLHGVAPSAPGDADACSRPCA